MYPVGGRGAEKEGWTVTGVSSGAGQSHGEGFTGRPRKGGCSSC